MSHVLKKKSYFSATIREVSVTATVEKEEYEPYPHKIHLFAYINQSEHSVLLEIGAGEDDWQRIFDRCDAEFCRKWILQQHELFAHMVVPAMWDLLRAPVAAADEKAS